MSNQLTNNAEALRLFLTEDIYLIGEPTGFSTPENIPSPEQKAVLEEPVAVESTVPSMVQEPVQPFKKTYDFKYKGKNQKGMLILVNDKDNDLSTADGTALLTKLMVAIKVTGNDVALINYAKYEGATYNDFFGALQCNIVLSFGVSSTELQIPPVAMHGISNYQASKIIITQSLQDLAADEPAKRQLWNTLKTLI